MSKRFGAQHIRNGYAAMGGHHRRPLHKGFDTGRSVAQAIAEERARAARQAKISSTKKK